MSKKERKLTEAEQERKIDFQRTKEEFIEKGYEEHDLTLGVVYANLRQL